jgi:hypothetical protein
MGPNKKGLFPEIDDAVFTIVQERCRTGINCIVLFLWHIQQLLSFFQNASLDSESNPHVIQICI